VAVVTAARLAYPFLAPSAPVETDTLVVEGWLPDYALEQAMAEFKRRPYRRLLVTGVPLDKGAPLSEYRTYAELGAATLVRLGMSADVVVPVPAPKVRQERTVACARALRDWMVARGELTARFNLFSGGAHSRRSRFLFSRTFGADTDVGIIPAEPFEYDPARWWRSSMGFRDVTGEFIAYTYFRLFFRPTPDPVERRD
jgi:hypothetical protein